MFTYCVERLHSFELVASGALHLSGINILAPELTEENHGALLAEASGKTKRAIEELVRARAPKPDVPQIVRKLPTPVPPASLPFQPAPQQAPIERPVAPQQRPAPKPVVAPLAEDRFKLQLTVSRAMKEKLDTAKALLRHRIPNGDLEKVLELALDELLAATMKKKFAATSKPKNESPSSEQRTRHIPAAVKREVVARDQLRCTFVSPDGHRCSERAFLELDHRMPYAKGGGATVENIRLRCRAHNGHAAELAYGRDFMKRKKQLAPGRVRRVNCTNGQLSFSS